MRLSILVFTLFSFTPAFSQGKDVDSKPQIPEVVIKKLIISDDIDRQVKDIPFATIRVFVRFKLASFLWKEGKDDTQRAEQIAVKAMDDLYENKTEIPPVYFNSLATDLLALLDRYAKDAARKLIEKHKIVHENGVVPSDSLLNQKDGDKLSVDSVIRSLTNQAETNTELAFLLGRLTEKKSSELVRLLLAIVKAEESGQTNFSSTILTFICNYFVEPSVPTNIQKRFLKIVIDKSKNASMMPYGDYEGFFTLLTRLIPNISYSYPEMLPEVSVIHAVLKTRASHESREAQERSERIDNASDRLSAMVNEAEQANDKAVKYDLYISAAQLALKQKKFIYSIDLIEKTSEIGLVASSAKENFQKRLRDQFRAEVVDDALKSNDSNAANYAVKKMHDPMVKVESFRKMSHYHFDKGDQISSGYAFDEAMKLAAKAEITSRNISSLFYFLPTAQKIDQTRISDISGLIIKHINSIPSLNVDDKPNTEKYKNYVTAVMVVNWNLLPALTRLARENKIEAVNFADSINKKEIKIVADFALMIESLSILNDGKSPTMPLRNN